MVLPAVLYSNRAQCHLNNENWITALSDCNEALARCLEGSHLSAQLSICKFLQLHVRMFGVLTTLSFNLHNYFLVLKSLRLCVFDVSLFIPIFLFLYIHFSSCCSVNQKDFQLIFAVATLYRNSMQTLG